MMVMLQKITTFLVFVFVSKIFSPSKASLPPTTGPHAYPLILAVLPSQDLYTRQTQTSHCIPSNQSCKTLHPRWSFPGSLWVRLLSGTMNKSWVLRNRMFTLIFSILILRKEQTNVLEFIIYNVRFVFVYIINT